MQNGKIAGRSALRGAILAAMVLFVLTGTTSAQTVIWSEEFDSPTALENSVWSYDIGDGCDIGICGWGNAEFQQYTNDPANVRVEDGHLVITALRHAGANPNDDTFTSGRIKTQGKLTLRYGTVEARIQLPDLADGLWPAFWTLGNNISTVSWPACGEIDIFEMGSSGAIAENVINRRVASTAHWSDANDNYAGYGLSYTSPTDLDGSFHIYRMEWTPSYIRTFIDGIVIWTIGISNPANFGGEEFHNPHFLLLNMAVGGNYTGINEFPGDITASFPAEYRVDWIRIYDNGFTDLGGSGPPISLNAARTDSNFVELSFNTQYGLNYDVLSKINVTDPTWNVMQTIVGNGNTMSVSDAVASPARFYKIESYE